MKLYATALLIFFFAQIAYSQNAKLDSLDKLISKATTDTAKINLQNKKNIIISRINIDSAMALSKKSIEKSKSMNYEYGEAIARLNLANSYNMKGDFTSAAENLRISENIFFSLKDSFGICKTYSGYGTLYGMQSKYDTSIQYLEKAIAIAERNHFNDDLGTYYGNIAIGYQMQSNYAEALQYQQRSLDLSKAKNDNPGQAFINLNMGITYMSMGDTVRAEQFLLEAVRRAVTDNIKNVELYAYVNLTRVYSRKGKIEKSYELAMKATSLGKEMGDYGIASVSLSQAAYALATMQKFNDAEALAKQAMTMADSSGQTFNIYQVYSTMGHILQQQGKYTEAIPIFEKSITVLEKTDLYNAEVEATYGNLSFCYEKTGNFSKALSFYKLAAGLADSIRSRDNIRKATELSMNYEFNKKQEAQRLEQKNKDAITRTRQLALIIGLALASVLVVVAYRGYRTKQKANSQLQQQKDELETTLIKLKETQNQLIQSEKMASLGELTAGIAHEIQNPLNFVNNFSELNAELIDELKEEVAKGNTEDVILLANDIKANEQKINYHGKRADAIVKGMLQHSRANSGKKEPTDINALANEYIRLSYHGLRAKDKTFNADFKTDFDERIGKINIIPQDIGRVFLNVLNNAFYSVNKKKQSGTVAGYEPEVNIRTRQEEGYVIITIHDNGWGIPQAIVDKIYQPFFTTKPTGEGTGLGLSMSYDIITKSHNGRLDVKTEEGKFAEFSITLPVS